MFKKFLRFWTGPLPDQELFPMDRKVNPVLHWFIHPIKRRLAKYYLVILQQFFGLKVIALTGSSGKTTTANMLYSVLSEVGVTVKTADSITSTYNLPTTILTCTPQTRYLILEMGVEYPGDMDFYCWLARPDISFVLNVSSVHASFFGSVTGIAREKNKLLKYSRIGLSKKDFVKIISSKITPDFKTEIKILINHISYLISLPLLGPHLAQNVSAVVKVCELLKIPLQIVKSGLESVKPPSHRMNVNQLKNGSILLDDTYNANPLSVTEALNTLSHISNLKSLTPVFVFGQMNELGNYEKSAHEDIGRLVKKLQIKDFYCLGSATRYSLKSAGFGQYYSTLDHLQTDIKKWLMGNDKCVILVKGSHSWQLDKLVSKLAS